MTSEDAVPQPLADAQIAASSALTSSIDAVTQGGPGHLELPYRRAMWLAFDAPATRPYETGRRAGHHRRAALQILCAERTLHLWTEMFAETAPLEALLAARRVLQNRHEPERARRLAMELQARIEEEIYGQQHTGGRALAGHACVTALTATIADDDPRDIPPTTSDLDYDPDEWDASYLASSAAAGGQPGRAGSRPWDRAAFWRWYIFEAVPAAYRSI